VEQFHGSTSGADLVELAIGVRAEEPWLLTPDRLGVGVLFARLTVAVGGVGDLGEGGNEEEEDI
jgi:hypothetical protein